MGPTYVHHTEIGWTSALGIRYAQAEQGDKAKAIHLAHYQRCAMQMKGVQVSHEA